MLRRGARASCSCAWSSRSSRPPATGSCCARSLRPTRSAAGSVLDPRPRKHGPGAAHVRRLRALRERRPAGGAAARAGERAVGRRAPRRARSLLAQLERAGAGRAPPAATQRRAGSRRARSSTRARRGAARRCRAAAGARAAARWRGWPRSRPAGGVGRAGGPGRGGSACASATACSGAAARPARSTTRSGRRLAELVRADGHAPRAPDALARGGRGRPRRRRSRALDRLAAEGALVRLRPGVYFDAGGARGRARAAVVAACERDGSVTIAQLRDALGTSRKHAQAILEHLDAARITRRRGDEHVLRSRSHLVASWAPMRMRQSMAQLEREFEEQAVLERQQPRAAAARGDQAHPHAAPREDRARPAAALPAADRVDRAHGGGRHRGDVRDACLADGLACPARALAAFFGGEVLERLVYLFAAACRLLLLDLEVDLFAEHREWCAAPGCLSGPSRP